MKLFPKFSNVTLQIFSPSNPKDVSLQMAVVVIEPTQTEIILRQRFRLFDFNQITLGVHPCSTFHHLQLRRYFQLLGMTTQGA